MDSRNSYDTKRLDYLLKKSTEYLCQLFRIEYLEQLNVKYLFYVSTPIRKKQIHDNFKFKDRGEVSNMNSIRYSIVNVSDFTVALKDIVLSY